MKETCVCACKPILPTDNRANNTFDLLITVFNKKHNRDSTGTVRAACFFFSLFPLHLYSSSLLPTHRQKNNKGKPQLPRGPSCPSRGNEYGSYLIHVDKMRRN